MELKIGDRNINLHESKVFINFMMKFLENQVAKKIELIYRGENIFSLMSKLGIKNQNDFEALSSRLFLLGDKARYFRLAKNHSYLKTFKSTVNNSNPLFFQYIFKKLRESTKNAHPKYVKFYDKNTEFKSFFKTDKNLDEFVISMQRLSVNDQIQAKNYYLRLLHQFGAIGYKEKSHFLSTTRSLEIANHFAGDQKKNIIIRGWVSIQNVTKINFLRETNLPNYQSGPFNQRELSLEAGLLPHFIIDFRVASTNTFYINPNIFNQPITKKTFTNGLDIDQSNFLSEMEATAYSMYFTSTNGFIKEEELPEL